MAVQNGSSRLRLKWTSKTRPEGIEQNYGLRGGPAVLVGGKIIWVGANGRLFMFCLKTWTWSQNPQVFESVSYKDTAILCEDKIYFCGASHLFGFLEYDVTLDNMRLIESSYTIPMRSEGMSVVYARWRRELIYFGGHLAYPGGQCNNDTHTFNVDSCTWKKLEMDGEQPQPRSRHSAVLLGSRMYVFGGSNNARNCFNDLWIAHFASKLRPAWSKPRVSGLLPSSRAEASLKFLHGRFVLFGGYDGVNVLRDLHIFCLRNLEWKDSSHSEVDIRGVEPVQAIAHQAVATSNGVLIFTLSRICLLSCDPAP